MVVMDRPTTATEEQVRRHSSRIERLERIDLGDPGSARNVGIRASTGRMIAMIDGDDLVSEGWLGKSTRYLASCESETVVHGGP